MFRPLVACGNDVGLGANKHGGCRGALKEDSFRS